MYYNEVARHEDGYLTFRLNLNDHLKEANMLAISVNHGDNRNISSRRINL